MLRSYQERLFNQTWRSYAIGRRAPLVQLPAVGGKTIVFSEIARGARAKCRRVLIVAHRRELIRQASGKLTQAEVPHGIICPGFGVSPDELVQVASVQTLASRLSAICSFELIIFDEAHHCVAGTWKELLATQRQAKLLGLTATPARLDGKGLGVEAGGPFDDLIVGPSIGELVREGFLSPARCFVPDHRLDLSGIRIRAGDSNIYLHYLALHLF